MSSVYASFYLSLFILHDISGVVYHQCLVIVTVDCNVIDLGIKCDVKNKKTEAQPKPASILDRNVYIFILSKILLLLLKLAPYFNN